MANKVVTVLKEVGEVLAWPFVHISRTVAVITVALKDYPAVRTAVVGLVQQFPDHSFRHRRSCSSRRTRPGTRRRRTRGRGRPFQLRKEHVSAAGRTPPITTRSQLQPPPLKPTQPRPRPLVQRRSKLQRHAPPIRRLQRPPRSRPRAARLQTNSPSAGKKGTLRKRQSTGGRGPGLALLSLLP